MGWEIAGLVVLKLAALTLLWLVFFSAADRPRVDDESTRCQLAIAPTHDTASAEKRCNGERLR
jgi:hypothetical protein